MNKGDERVWNFIKGLESVKKNLEKYKIWNEVSLDEYNSTAKD